MNPLVLIIGFIIGLVFVLSYGWISKVLYKSKFSEIFKAHASIGYPKLSKQDQFQILDNENQNVISKLTKHEFVPYYLLDHYVNIKPEEYLEHLKEIDIFNQLNLDKQDDKLIDGFYIEKRGTDYYYLFNDRRSRIFEKRFKNPDKLIRYIAYYRLVTLVPKYKRVLKKTFYT